MARHRNVRTMNYEDEYDGYDDVYGHSFDDSEICASPATASQFMFNRDGGTHALSSFMHKESSIPEELQEDLSDEETQPLNDSRNYQRPKLSDIDEARLNSCLEEIRNVLGDSTPEHVLIEAILQHQFNFEKALDHLLLQKEAPKEQRPPRESRRTDEECDSMSFTLEKGRVDPQLPVNPIISNVKPPPGFKAICHNEVSSPGLDKSTVSTQSKLSSYQIKKNTGASPIMSLGQLTEAHTKSANQETSELNTGEIQKGKYGESKGKDQFAAEKSKQGEDIPRSGMSLSALAKQHQTPSPDSVSQTSTVQNPSLSMLAGKHAGSPGQGLSLSAIAKQHSSNPLPSSGLSLSDLAKQHSASPPHFSSGVSLSDLAKQHSSSPTHFSSGVSLSDLAKHHSSSPTHFSSGVSLSDLAKQQSASPPHFSSGVSLSDLAKQHSSSPTHFSSGVSLSDLAKHHSSSPTHFSSGVSLSDLAKQQSASPPHFSSGVSLSDLAKQHSSSPTHFSSGVSLSDLAKQHSASPPHFSSGISLSDLAKQHSSSPTNFSSGVSLSDLAKQHSSNPSLSQLAKEHKEKQQSSVLKHDMETSRGKKVLGSSQQGNKGSVSFIKVVTANNRTKTKPDSAAQDPLKKFSISKMKTTRLRTESDKENMESNFEDSTPFSDTQIAQELICNKPSFFGRILCCKYTGNEADNHNAQIINFKRFSYMLQSKEKPTAMKKPLHEIVPFLFFTPSPDDLVKQRQSAAYSRTGQQKFGSGVSKPAFTLGSPPKPPSSSANPGGARSKNEPVRNTTEPPKQNATQQATRMKFTGNNTNKTKGFNVDKDTARTKTGPKIIHSSKSEPRLSSLSTKFAVNNDFDVKQTQSDEAVTNDRLSAIEVETDDFFSITPKKDSLDPNSTAAIPKSSSKSAKKNKVNTKLEYEKRKDGKDLLNLVVIGHVDAGKSTLMGHVLYQLDCVNKRTMHKYEQEAKKIGKASFAYAWVLDETEEERARGVTMDVAQTTFETDSKRVTLLDAPGHKDFIPNMITGAAQADVAILVVNSTRGEFETGFETGGQTREHALLVRSLGVSQLAVAINKMDTVEWSKIRFDEIVKKLGTFLKQAGFKESDVTYIPCSGLSGENLAKPATDPKLTEWYQGATLLAQIDKFKSPERPIEKSFRLCVSDVFKGTGAGISVSGRLESGTAQPGDRVIAMPGGDPANVKSVMINDAAEACVFAGDHATITLTGIDMVNINVGTIICAYNDPIKVTSRLKARVVIFNIDVPITKGFPVVFHCQAVTEPAHIRKIISQLHKSTGEVVKKKPKCLSKNMSALVEIEVSRPICIELYKEYKDLGRFMLRYAGSTIAAGLVTEIIDPKSKA
ncbi:unnamed protein product [Owenia fusiformis]|uniref:Tr-type G domain-containing protein n=1 Tax=Owenia fusiformis TaxID=6347 RepID=A0A8S4N3S0_OWEFU|nr:unnamed protein product [Owenia fusiformis]